VTAEVREQRSERCIIVLLQERCRGFPDSGFDPRTPNGAALIVER